MIVVLIPFFLVAHLVDKTWPNGAESTYQFCVNSTGLVDSRQADTSSRLNFEARLRCQHLAPASLSCRITDTAAVSFASRNLDPRATHPEPLPETIEVHREYQISEEAFQVVFDPTGLCKLIVNKTISPNDLSVVRAVVNQLNVGANMTRRRHQESFLQSEKSVLGKCDTRFHVLRNATYNETICTAYRLAGLDSLGKDEDHAMKLEKQRNVYRCSIRSDYFFASRESYITRQQLHMRAQLVSSESSIYVSDMNFGSLTFNELRIPRDHLDDLIVYENLSLRLLSINKAPHPPPNITEPATASIYAYQYIDNYAEESNTGNNNKRAEKKRAEKNEV